jgi:uncharacterized membrane protein YoaK (UPF0700 family)
MIATSPTSKLSNISSFLISDGPAGFLLSWVAGFCDTSGFIILFGIFTAHVTGNIALAGSSIVSEDARMTITRLLMLPTFMVTVALTSLLARYARGKQWCVFGVLLTAEALALIVFLVLGNLFSPALVLDVQEEYILPIGISGVVAMAIQNALMKESKGVFKSYIPTTVMTGNVTQFTIDLVLLLLGKSSQSDTAATEAAEAWERMGRFLPVMAGFALGGLGAAYFILVSESWLSLVFPVVIISVLATAAYIDHYRAV